MRIEVGMEYDGFNIRVSRGLPGSPWFNYRFSHNFDEQDYRKLRQALEHIAPEDTKVTLEEVI